MAFYIYIASSLRLPQITSKYLQKKRRELKKKAAKNRKRDMILETDLSYLKIELMPLVFKE